MGESSWWGWGDESAALGDAERDALARLVQARLGVTLPDPLTPPLISTVQLRKPALAAPTSIAACATNTPRERLRHSRGRSFRDVARNLRGEFDHVTDLVASPFAEEDVVRVLEWASTARAAVIPFGGGSSVVGGIEPDIGDGYVGAVSLDLRHLDRVLDVDSTSLAARIQAGARGPAIERQLRPHGLSLRHQPQSFEFSTLGGWIATRSAGHFSTLTTRIDDAVESLRVVAPSGVIETRRLPSSGAGPDPNRLFAGSEGTLGVITEAWVRVRRRPAHRASATLRFAGFDSGLNAERALAQSGLYPSSCRLLDPLETLLGGVGDGSTSLLLLGFESADHAVDSWLHRGVEIARDHGGQVDADPTGDDRAARTWRTGFVRAPYLRDALVTLGLVVETFESAATWDRIASLLDGVREQATAALTELGMRGLVSCRITHAYPDGAAPYWTVVAFGDPRAQVEQWDALKAAVSEAILKAGGTITHHHSVGRDHRAWYDRERPEPFADALRAVKRTLDPADILNPGVLIRT